MDEERAKLERTEEEDKNKRRKNVYEP